MVFFLLNDVECFSCSLSFGRCVFCHFSVLKALNVRILKPSGSRRKDVFLFDRKDRSTFPVRNLFPTLSREKRQDLVVFLPHLRESLYRIRQGKAMTGSETKQGPEDFSKKLMSSVNSPLLQIQTLNLDPLLEHKRRKTSFSLWKLRQANATNKNRIPREALKKAKYDLKSYYQKSTINDQPYKTKQTRISQISENKTKKHIPKNPRNSKH